MTTLGDLATTFRSKNAEPFMTTMDIFFPDDKTYQQVKTSGVLTEDRMAELYHVPREAVYGIYWIDTVWAVKATIYKYGRNGYLGQGDPEISDMFGAQMHVPLLGVELPA